MRCYKCGSVLTEADYCPNCGALVTSFKRIVHCSNIYYNEGLEKARAADLSGAAESLRKSLKYHKRNVTARNLLGLVYYGQGKLSYAIAEWIVSSNILPQENPASEYLRFIEEDKNGSDAMQQQIKQYNEALDFLKSGNDDLAFLQLKKVVQSGTRLVEAYELMALFCMRSRQYRLAGQCLRQALAIDRGSVTAGRYLNELRELGGKKLTIVDDELKPGDQKRMFLRRDVSLRSGEGTGREMTPQASAIRIGAGFLAAALIFGFLIMPARMQSVREESNRSAVLYGDNLTDKDEQINQLEEELTVAQGTAESAGTTSEQATKTANAYEAMLAMEDQLDSGSYNAIELAQTIKEINRDGLAPYGQAIYDRLYSEIFEEAVENLYYEGERNVGWGEYETAATAYEQAISLNPSYQGGVMYIRLAQCYVNMGNSAKAKETYQALLDEIPDSDYSGEARAGITAINAERAAENAGGDDESSDDYDESYDETYDEEY